ncbi:MAG: calcium-binding protein [Gemmataceae bacterium]
MLRFWRKTATKNPLVGRKVRPMLEGLETRAVPAGMSLSGTTGQLAIEGSEGADQIRIQWTSSQVVVQLNGQTQAFNRASVNSLLVRGNAGSDLISNSTSIRMTAQGGLGNDRLEGGASRDILEGGAGSDQLFGRGGNDVVRGGLGADLVSGGVGDDSLTGQSGNDTIDGNSGRDNLFGEIGDDRLFGGNDNDYLSGGSGRDVLNGGLGTDMAAHDTDDYGDDCEGQELVAALTGATGGGKADYEPGTGGSKAFEVEVYHLAPSATYSVVVDGQQIGTLTTTSEGEGKLVSSRTDLGIVVNSVIQIVGSNGSVALQGTYVLAPNDSSGSDD